MKSNVKRIPAVEKLLQALGESSLPRPFVLSVVRKELEELRRSDAPVGEFEEVVASIEGALDREYRQRLQPVVNGTGVLIHTNLGRSPLDPAAIGHLAEIASGYNNLELDLTTGERGKRGGFLEKCLALLAGAEAATVVNNCASALVIILRYFVREGRHEVIISRSQLIEIGGGFRIPDILLASGATLKEIGTTNKTSLADYENAINEKTALILNVHQSNFYMGGFVENPTSEEISELAKEKGIPFAEDLGSGAVEDTGAFEGMEREPTPAEILGKGIELVCVSGDKLFGGSQAGIIAGRADLVAGIKKEPFFRALRCDKLVLSVLEATAVRYLEGKGNALPLLSMMGYACEALRERADSLVAAVGDAPAKLSVGDSVARVGGGTMPKSAIPSVTLDIEPVSMSLTRFARRLRYGTPAVMGYSDAGRFRIDLRTVFPGQDDDLASAVKDALSV